MKCALLTQSFGKISKTGFFFFHFFEKKNCLGGSFLEFLCVFSLFGDALFLHDPVEIFPAQGGNVHGLKLLTVLVEELESGRLARDLLELCVVVQHLEIFPQKRLHFGKLVQASSSARLDDSRVDHAVFSIGNVLASQPTADCQEHSRRHQQNLHDLNAFPELRQLDLLFPVSKVKSEVKSEVKNEK